MNATTTCSYYNAVHWDKTGDVGSFQPLDSTDPNGTAFQFASSSCSVQYGYSSSTDQSVAGGFSYGDLVISTILLLILACALTLTYFFHFRKVRIKN